MAVILSFLMFKWINHCYSHRSGLDWDMHVLASWQPNNRQHYFVQVRLWHFQILTFSDSDIFWIWQKMCCLLFGCHDASTCISQSKVLMPANAWHFQILTFSGCKDSDIFRFWRFLVLKHSDIFRSWRFPVLKDSDIFQ